MPTPDPARAAFHRGLAAHTDVLAALVSMARDIPEALAMLDRVALDQRRNARDAEVGR